jgi:HD-GYP domain-containing protein (c-di-GMP phosphodiesterase class II)
LVIVVSLLHTGARRVRNVLAMLAGGRKYVEMNLRTACEVGDVLLGRLGMSDSVRDSLRFTFERWNGNGFPDGAKGGSIPLPMRVVHLSHDMEAISRIQGADAAIDAARTRSGRTYDPDIVDVFIRCANDIFQHVDKVDPWDEALAGEPPPHHVLRDSDLDDLRVAADFIDLKSPYTAGHSRGVADLAAAAVEYLGMDPADARAARRAGWAHDFGRTAIPNSIWDKPEPLTRSEVDRVQLHPLLTEQMLRRGAGLATLNPIASGHHEKLDGSGYSKGLSGSVLSPAARVVAAADCYQAMTEDRAHRPALTPTHAAAEARLMVERGKLDAEVTEAVLRAAGKGSRARRRRVYPAGLTEREVQVLRLAAQGLTAKQIAERLVISAKTADHHIQHIYTKIGVSTRGAAALFAIEHDLVQPRSS